jgi:hypothetical protein
MFAALHRLLRGRKGPAIDPHPTLEQEEEEAEIARNQREARRDADKFAESLIEKAGHKDYPYLKDPFE